MFIPNGFVPSDTVRRLTYDNEGRLRESNISRGATGGIAESNSLFSTDAEKFGSIAPFLRMAKAKDAERRNYVVQPGGNIVYFNEMPPPAEKAEFPDDRTSFGHETNPGGGMQAQPGRAFTLGEQAGRQVPGRAR